ncbi:hypothetical protein R1flu_024812 [Riccia fluitans]|uniref:Uncharacterized protein n=1 Tax=Riccia fluitans TaxID=41844 RepID=A0ABD1XWE2_9MARC
MPKSVSDIKTLLDLTAKRIIEKRTNSTEIAGFLEEAEVTSTPRYTNRLTKGGGGLKLKEFYPALLELLSRSSVEITSLSAGLP